VKFPFPEFPTAFGPERSYTESDQSFSSGRASRVGELRAARGESYSDATLRAARGLVRLAEPLLIMAALFAAPIITKEISRCRAITD
jgi:hypothetical protein